MKNRKLEEFLFMIVTILIMVYFMTLFNFSRQQGLSYGVFFYTLKHMWIEVIIAYFMLNFIAIPNIKKIDINTGNQYLTVLCQVWGSKK